ncbi:MAG: futalosine hydrolase [Bacteroidota bacterium]
MESVLLVAATALETQGLRKTLELKQVNPDVFEGLFRTKKLRLLHTGIGMVNAAWKLGGYLAHQAPDFALHLGIAGSFDPAIGIGEAVEVRQNTFAELGAEDGDRFLSLEEMSFPLFRENDQSVYNTLLNPHPALTKLPQVHSITVNRVHGAEKSIEKTQALWHPQIESMEGAAFFLAMRQSGIPFAEIRTISNRVERRNRAQWDIPAALAQLDSVILRILEDMFP